MTFRNYTLEDREWIKSRYKQSSIWDDPYLILPKCCEYMSPIERNVRSDLKCAWIRMYPQYPAWKYFIDFADPERKIRIEQIDKEKREKQRIEREKNLPPIPDEFTG